MKKLSKLVLAVSLAISMKSPLQAEKLRHLLDLRAAQTFIVSKSSGRFTCGKVGSAWVPGKVSGTNFVPYSAQLKNAKNAARKAKGKKRTKLLKTIKSLKATIAKSKGVCAGGPPNSGGGGTGGGGGSTATPTPSVSGNFDNNGNVTSAGKALFGIPSGLGANVSTGRSVFLSNCSGCHTEKLGRTMGQYRVLTSQSPMLFSPSDLPDSALANLTAYLNRFRQ